MILVVDDDKPITELMHRILRDMGYRVETAYDGESAWEHLRDPDCRGMILDMRMPGINRAELLLLMQAEGIEVPVIITTAFVDFEEDELKEFVNVRKLILKPFDPDEIVTAVREHFGAAAPRAVPAP